MKIKMLASALLLGLSITSTVSAIDYQHIRNATAKVNFGGTTFLVDPYLAEQGAYAGFEGTVNSEKRNPLIAMPLSKEELLKDLQAVIVTHTHPDHWDEAAQKMIDKSLPVFVQNAGDAKIIRSQGFKDVRVIGLNTDFNGVKLSRIKGGQHGSDAMYSVPVLAEFLGDAMGVVMQANGEKTAYIVGDTVWNPSVDEALKAYKPEVIIMNTGKAQLAAPEFKNQGIIMGLEDVAKMAQAAPAANIVTVHMDAVNHATVSSNDMRQFVKTKNLQQVAVPKEGEVLKY